MTTNIQSEYPPHTHLLKCRHQIGRNGFDYYMPCNILKTTKSGKIKIEVYGERWLIYKKNKKQIRYVDKWRLKEASNGI